MEATQNEMLFQREQWHSANASFTNSRLDSSVRQSCSPPPLQTFLFKKQRTYTGFSPTCATTQWQTCNKDAKRHLLYCRQKMEGKINSKKYIRILSDGYFNSSVTTAEQTSWFVRPCS
jgi:hypothetical protein